MIQFNVSQSLRLFALLLATACHHLPALGENAAAAGELGKSVLNQEASVDDREVYIVTSKLRGTVPKVGAILHASIAICPKGVSPIVYENGVAVSNCYECKLYGTQVMERGFQLERKRIGVSATKVYGISAATAERRMRNHNALNIPILNDCRHHVIQALGIRNRRGHLKRPISLK
ncbi:hypothetical protein EC9_46360 [Rosistilla ulvae]|uniref:Uncharacterized protein n=1 Tax=Rosistilla ulvae TaxID=1930277 RepID=A0A517M6C5_9BACT|nr:hypothetical protein [Rosistilla ulvae]QDS90428.1 hypothetical protein EC9_46360 [Rosistilla ulvae]